MKIKTDVLKKGSKVAYKLDVGDGRFSVSEMPAEVAAGIIAKGKKGVEAKGYMKVDDRHYFPVNVIDFKESAKDEAYEAAVPEKDAQPETAVPDKSITKG